MRNITTLINNLLGFLYPLFSRILPESTFRYLACGGTNSALDLILFTLSYSWIFKGNLVNIGILAISPHIASLFLSLIITIPTGFLLSKYIVFQVVANHKIQLLKYVIIVALSLIVNYILMKFFVEKIHLTPLISKICTTAIVVIFSYISQKKIAFKS